MLGSWKVLNNATYEAQREFDKCLGLDECDLVRGCLKIIV